MCLVIKYLFYERYSFGLYIYKKKDFWSLITCTDEYKQFTCLKRSAEKEKKRKNYKSGSINNLAQFIDMEYTFM